MFSGRALLLCCLCLICVWRRGGCQSGRFVQGYLDSLLEYTDLIGSYIPAKIDFGLSQSLYNVDFSESIRKRLQRFIGGQDEAIEQIVSSFQSWEFGKGSGSNAPLVLAIFGPSGVGKSESAFRISQALFNKVGDDLNAVPKPSLVLRGEDYSEVAEVVVQHGIAEARRQMRNQIIQHLQLTHGDAIIIFDEVQKVMPGILEVFLPALDANGFFSQVTYHPVTKEPVTKYYSTKNVVFLFISDIGHDMLTKAVLRYNDRHLIDGTFLKNEVKALLDKQWERLQFGKTITHVIPYMPLEPFHIDLILHKQLDYLSQQGMQDQKWLRLVIDEDVFDWLAIAESYNYESVTAEFAIFNESIGVEEIVERTKYFARWGARAGPLAMLRGYLMQMRPWKPLELLHVGKLDPQLSSKLCPKNLAPVTASSSASSSSGGLANNRPATAPNREQQESSESLKDTLFIQWCHRKPYMLRSCQVLDEASGPGTCANMQRMPLARYQSESLAIPRDIALDSTICHDAMCIAL